MDPLNNKDLKHCIEYLNVEGENIPLPCRENEISSIMNFIQDAFSSDEPINNDSKRSKKGKTKDITISKPTIMFVSGNPGTGKTASIKFCIQQSESPERIMFINAKIQSIAYFTEKDVIPKVYVIDEVESYTSISNIIDNGKRLHYSLIFISNVHDDSTIQKVTTGLMIQKIRFESYNENDILRILTERTGGLNENLDQKALLFLAKRVVKDRGDARAAINRLNSILADALQKGINKIDLKTMVKLYDGQNTSIHDSSIIQEMPLYHQIALISIFKSGKKWVDNFHRITREKGLEKYSDVKELFDVLASYPNIIKGSFQNPSSLVDRDTLELSIDTAIKNFL